MKLGGGTRQVYTGIGGGMGRYDRISSHTCRKISRTKKNILNDLKARQGAVE